MTMASTVGEKGQIVIEKPIRDALGIEPGYVAVQAIVGNHIELRFYPPEHNRSLKGILAGYVQRSVSEEEWPQAKEEAWAQATIEDWAQEDEKR